MGGYAALSYIGTKRTELGSEKSNGSGTWINTMKYPEHMPPRFLPCVSTILIILPL